MNHITLLCLIAVISIPSTLSHQNKHKRRHNHQHKSQDVNTYPSTGCGNDEYEFEFDPTTNNNYEEILLHDNIERNYITHLPSTYDHSSNIGHPLILNLHGATRTAEERMTDSLMNQHSDENNYIAVYPDSTSLGYAEIFDGYNVSMKIWNQLSCAGSPTADGPTCSQFEYGNQILYDLLPDNCKDVFGCNYCDCNIDDIDFIDSLLDELEAKYCIDRSRIYVTGFSNGGQMSQRLGCELNDRLAAIAPIQGQLNLGHNCKPKYDDYKMPILNVWGTNDDILPGDTIISSANTWFLSVYQVMYKYGEHNKCNVNNNKYVSIPSVSDGINEWQCVGYDQCDFDNNGEKTVDVMSCSWNGDHVYPMILQNDTNIWENIGLKVVWNFFKDKTKIPRN